MRVPEWVSWTAAIASIAGLILSAIVLVVACLWRRMAERLLLAVQGRTLAEELARLRTEAEHLVTSVSRRQPAEARPTVRRLRADVGAILARRAPVMGPSDITDLNRVHTLTQKIDERLATDCGEEAWEQLRRDCRRCADFATTVLGHVQRALDRTTKGGPG